MAELRAFFQRLGRGFLRTLDRTTCREALVAQHTHLLDRGLGARAAKLEQLHIAGACFAVFVEGFGFFWLWAPQHQQFANMLNRRSIQLFAKHLVHGFTLGTVITKNAHFDQAMGVQSGIDFFLYTRG